MKRRTFIKHTGHLTALPVIFSGVMTNPLYKSLLQMATETDRVLVLIFLNGGNDGLNTIVPLDQLDVMHSLRPHVVMPEDKLLKLSGVGNIGFHPSLKRLRGLFDEGKVKVIQNVGYEEQDFSHFRSTDIWMSGSDSDELYASGWAGRYLHHEYPNYPVDYPNATMPDPLAIEIGFGGSLLFQGPSANMGLVINDPTWFYQLVENKEKEAPDTKAGEKLRYVRLVARQSQVYGQIVKKAAERVTRQVNYPEGNPLADQLKIVSRLIAGGLKTRMYMVQLPGFDTHDSQVEESDHTLGEHAQLLSYLDESIKAFTDDLKFLGTNQRVMGMTFSEFGRRIVSNASLGTDHGSSAPLILFGDNLEGGILGENPQLNKSMTYADNLTHEFDFRQVYASVLEQWLCVSGNNLPEILLKDKPTIPIAPDAGCVPTYIRKNNKNAGKSLFQFSPNPVSDSITIQFEAFDECVQIDLFTIEGRTCQQLVNQKYPMGKHELNVVLTTHNPGVYIISYRSGHLTQSKRLMVRGL